MGENPHDSATIPKAGFGLNHMGFVVSDLEKAHDFYVNVVGMKAEGVHEVESEAFDKLMNSKGIHIKFWYLNMNGFRLQIMKYLNGAGENLALHHNKRGCPHLCFEVANAKQKFDEIKQRGDIKIISEIVTQKYGNMLAHSFYVEDPDGMPVEFGQVEKVA